MRDMISRFWPAAAVLLLAVFLLAGWFGGPQNALDQAISQSAAEMRVQLPWLPRLAAWLTLLGGLPVTIGSAAIAAIFLWRDRRWRPALLLLVTVIGERLFVDGFKEWVGRPRPELEDLPTSLAYPSGHAANSMTAFLAVALLAFPPALRRTAAWFAVALSIIIGLTRIIMGVHWPSDVVGGWAFGLFAVGTALLVGERSGVLAIESKHQIIGRHLPTAGEDKTP